MGVKQEKKHCDEPDWRTEILEREELINYTIILLLLR